MKLILNYTYLFIKNILFMIIILPYISFSSPSLFQKCKNFISQMNHKRPSQPIQSRYLQNRPYSKNLHQMKAHHEKLTLQEENQYYQAIQNLLHLQDQLEEADQPEHIQLLEQKITQARDNINKIYNDNLENKITRLNEIRHLEGKPPLTKEEISKNDQMHNLLRQVIGDPK